MLFFFQHYMVYPMVCFNIFSIIFYILTPLLIKNKKIFAYAVLVYLEVVAHMSLAVIFVGADAGFQVTLIGLNILVFYAEYLSISLGLKPLSGVSMCLIGMVAYLGSLAYSKTHTPPYQLPDDVNFWLQIAWGAIVFIICIIFLKVFVLITTRSERQLDDLAKHDALTGVFNRAGYVEKLDAADIRKIILIIADLDHFKEVNDNFGHETGDLILKKTADAFRNSFRADDYICRIGGDEFAVIMQTPAEIPEDLIEEKITHINSILSDTSDELPKISVSAGAAYGSEAEDIKTLFKNADKALYLTKQKGRNGINIYRAAEQ